MAAGSFNMFWTPTRCAYPDSPDFHLPAGRAEPYNPNNATHQNVSARSPQALLTTPLRPGCVPVCGRGGGDQSRTHLPLHPDFESYGPSWCVWWMTAVDRGDSNLSVSSLSERLEPSPAKPCEHTLRRPDHKSGLHASGRSAGGVCCRSGSHA